MSTDLRRAAEEHFTRGNAFDENGHTERAIAEWQEAIGLDPEHVGAHYNLGIAYADEGETDLAINELREVTRLEPFDTDARRELAQIYLEADRPDDAINQLRHILNIAPGEGETAHQLAEIYLARGSIDQAAGALEAGAMADEDADLWFRVGKAYEQNERREDAILAYRRALVAAPDHREAERALLLLHAAPEEPPDPDEEL
ncbi:MAG: tetratricopeptide repeat protein [Chloroflexota bacterium]|nr:tetratricopeptide repeat protein [Chloroflexota bacterium]